MDKKAWLEVFDETQKSFEPIMDAWFPTLWESVLENRKIENWVMMVKLLQSAWERLPERIRIDYRKKEALQNLYNLIEA